MTRPGTLALLFFLLVGCASQTERPTTQRQALFGLGLRAADATITGPDWHLPVNEVVLLLVRPDIDSSLGVETEYFRETLTRALLAHENGPQVLNWAPSLSTTPSPENQWLLESRLAGSGPALELSDRQLLPYQLTLVLRRPNESSPRWQQTLNGALDASALY